MENPPKSYFRLAPDVEVRLRYAYLVKCVDVKKNKKGEIEAIHCTYDPQSKSGSAGAEARKVKGNIHWLSAPHAIQAEVRLYDRLFAHPHPDAGGKDYREFLNPRSKEVICAHLEPSLASSKPEDRYQFERHGYFVADLKDTKPGKSVFNRAVNLRDSWAKQSAKE